MIKQPQMELIAVDPAIADISHRLVNGLNPQYIFLFGSRARGDYHEWSDYDFMVIVDDNVPEDRRMRSYTTALMQGLSLEHDCDVKVYTRSEFESELHLKASLPYAAVADGKIIFFRPGEGKLKASQSKMLQVVEGPPAQYDPLIGKHTMQWLGYAITDLEYAKFGLSVGGNLLDGVMFHSQQAVEKSLKAFLIWHDYKAKRIHVLEELAKDCIQLDSSLKAIIQPAVWLSDWSLLGRYRGDRPAPTYSQGNDAFRTARKVVKAILERLPSPVHPPGCLP